MKISNNINNTNFRGYKNLISFSDEAQGCRLALFAAQLDDNEAADLEKYKKLANFPRCFNKNDIDDTIMCVYSETPDHKIMYMNNDILLNTKELNELAIKLNQKEFSVIEKGYLKAYTQLADLTKQIMNNNKVSARDIGIHKIITETQRMLTNLCNGDKTSAFKIVESAFYNINPQKTASTINAGISKALKNYF